MSCTTPPRSSRADYTAQKQTYVDASTRVVAAVEGFDYAYRDVGSGTVPLVTGITLPVNGGLLTT